MGKLAVWAQAHAVAALPLSLEQGIGAVVVVILLAGLLPRAAALSPAAKRTGCEMVIHGKIHRLVHQNVQGEDGRTQPTNRCLFMGMTSRERKVHFSRRAAEHRFLEAQGLVL